MATYAANTEGPLRSARRTAGGGVRTPEAGYTPREYGYDGETHRFDKIDPATASGPRALSPQQAVAGRATAADAGPAGQAGATTTDRAGTATATAATAAAPTTAQTTGFSARQNQLTPQATVQGQLKGLLGQDSSYLRRARQEGYLSAASRGLGNSSFAAGASTGAAIDRALPIAQQDAQTNYANDRANVDATNRAREVSTERETQASLQHAELDTQISALNAEMKTAVEQGNAQSINNMLQQRNELMTRVSQSNANLRQQHQQFQAQQENEISQLNAQLQTAVSQGNAQEANRLKLAVEQLRTQTNIANAEMKNQIYNAQMQADLSIVTNLLDGRQAENLQQLAHEQQELIQSRANRTALWVAGIETISAGANNNPENPTAGAQGVANVVIPYLKAALQYDGALETDIDNGVYGDATYSDRSRDSYPDYGGDYGR